jgi:nicotinate-nucleotide adenylyltransferase
MLHGSSAAKHGLRTATHRYSMRLGLFGGTFDPIHYGHLVLAEQCRQDCRLDKIWFIPAGQPPHKSNRNLTPAPRRVEMVELAIAGHPDFALCTFEIDRSGPSYTVETLEQLHREQPEWDLFFLIGSDSLAELSTWRQPDRIVQLAKLIVARRIGAQPPCMDDLQSFMDAGQIERLREYTVEISAVGIASTEIRRRVAAGRSIRYLLPRAVELYINTHGLYAGPPPRGGGPVRHGSP